GKGGDACFRRHEIRTAFLRRRLDELDNCLLGSSVVPRWQRVRLGVCLGKHQQEMQMRFASFGLSLGVSFEIFLLLVSGHSPSPKIRPSSLVTSFAGCNRETEILWFVFRGTSSSFSPFEPSLLQPTRG